MSKLKQLICGEVAGSALAFREYAYGSQDREALLIDILALANAQVPGSRLLVLGVRDQVGGKRKLRGVERDQLVQLMAFYQRAVAEFIEPALHVSMRHLQLMGRTIAVLLLRNCNDQPYVMRKSLSDRVRKGDGWIRRGTAQARLGRADLETMFTSAASGVGPGWDLQVVFANAALSARLSLPALPLGKKPSEIAGDRIRGLLEAKQTVRDRLGHTDTRMDRLAFARVHGADQPYEIQTPESLLSQLARSKADNAAADQYYANELRAHKVNMAVVNLGDAPLHDARVVLEVPARAGVDMARRLYSAPDTPEDRIPLGYPRIEDTASGFRIQANIGRVVPGGRKPVFSQPFRLLLRRAAVGCNLPVHYSLSGRQLPTPRTGVLHIHVTK
jgi:hypothetical protein